MKCVKVYKNLTTSAAYPSLGEAVASAQNGELIGEFWCALDGGAASTESAEDAK